MEGLLCPVGECPVSGRAGFSAGEKRNYGYLGLRKAKNAVRPLGEFYTMMPRRGSYKEGFNPPSVCLLFFFYHQALNQHPQHNLFRHFPAV